MNKNGFSLIEAILYLALSSIVLVAALYTMTFVAVDDKITKTNLVVNQEIERALQTMSLFMVIGDASQPYTVSPLGLNFTTINGEDVNIIYSSEDQQVVLTIDEIPLTLHSARTKITDLSFTELNSGGSIPLFEIAINASSGFDTSYDLRTAVSFSLNSN